jgi:uncharacterized protein (DUF983 family)
LFASIPDVKQQNSMTCPACSKPPLSFSTFMRKLQVLTLSCEACGAHLKVERRAGLPVLLLAATIGLVLGFGALWAYDADLPPYTLGFVVVVLLLAVAVVVKAFAWRSYRYIVQS